MDPTSSFPCRRSIDVAGNFVENVYFNIESRLFLAIFNSLAATTIFIRSLAKKSGLKIGYMKFNKSFIAF